MLQSLSRLVAQLFDFMVWPFSGMPPFVTMIVISVLTAIFALVVFKYTSNQSKIKKMKQSIKAQFLAIVLYKESLRVLLTATKRIFFYNWRYLGLNLVPLLVMIGPVILVMVNLDAWFGYRPAQVGDPIFVHAQVAQGTDLLQGRVELDAPEQLEATPPVRIPEQDKIYWRVKPKQDGDYKVAVVVNNERVEKQIVVGKEFARLSHVRHQSDWLNALLHPTEAAIKPGGQIKQVTVGYSPMDFNFLGWQMHWVYPYLILALLFALPLKGVFRVDF